MTSARLLPQPMPIVGRERELGEISALLSEPACRLVTLVGPGGIGKTRLALAAADQQRQHESFADGMVLVDLAGTVAPDFLPAAIGGALEISLWGVEEPVTQIQSYLSDKQVLLVVGNLEHLLARSGCLADFLSAAPALKILATSRERLNLREEWVYAVGGLAFPPGYAGISAVSEVEAYGAVQLFVQRARQMHHYFNLRAALTWSLDHGEGEVGLRIAAALHWVWEARGYLKEGYVWFSRLLAQSSGAAASVRAKALSRASELAGQLAHEPQATVWAQGALQLSRATDDEWNLAWSLSAASYFTERDIGQAAAMLEESLALFEGLQDPLGLSHARRRRAGCAIDQHDYTYAAELLQVALAADRQAGDLSATAWDLCFMGVALWRQHRRAEQVTDSLPPPTTLHDHWAAFTTQGG
jgi:hypothetical protein